MTDIYFNGGDGTVKLKKLIIYQLENFMSYMVETENGITYHSPVFKAVK